MEESLKFYEEIVGLTVDEMINFLKEKGIAIAEGPYQPNPHIKFFYIMDPNGLKSEPHITKVTCF